MVTVCALDPLNLWGGGGGGGVNRSIGEGIAIRPPVPARPGFGGHSSVSAG